MTGPLDEETKKRLGLEKARWIASRRVLLPEPMALGRTEVIPDIPLAWLIPDRMAARVVPEGIAIDCPDRVPIRVMSAEGGGETQGFRDRVLWTGEGRAVLQRPDGIGVVLDQQVDGIQVDEFALPGEDVPGFVEVDLDLSPILVTLKDPWLLNEVKQYDVEGRRVIGCGLFVRYFLENLTPEERAQATQAVLRGKEPDALSPVRNLLRGWGHDHVETVVNDSLSEVFLLRRDLDSLRSCCVPSDHTWVSEFVRVCTARDDLECLRELLGFIKRRDLDEPLQSLDEEASRFIPTIPIGLDPDNPRLLRALAREVDAWWTWPVQDPQEYDLLHHEDNGRG